MLKRSICLVTVVCLFGWTSSVGAQERSGNAPAQQPQAAQQSAVAVTAEPEAPRVVLQAETTASALRLMKFSGGLRDPAGNPRSGAVGLAFALYKDQQGGSPLWLEVHNAQLDEQGRYTVLLGSTKSEGLPLELFSSGEARWLGVQLNLPGEEEQPRVLLVSVPYALKAADAETLGGKPPSAFLLAEKAEGREAAGKPEAGKEATKETPSRHAVQTLNFVQKQGASGLEDSSIFDNGFVGIGTTAPNVKLSLGTDISAQKLALWDGLGDFYGLGVQPGRIVFHTANTERMAITSGGRVGIGTATPNVKLSLGTDVAAQKLALYDGASDFYGLGLGSGRMVFHTGNTEKMTLTAGGNLGVGTAAPAEKVEVAGNVKITGGGNGIIFPDATVQTTAGGDITAVVAGIGLTGGALSGSATLELSGGARARGITYLAGCDSCGALADNDDQKTIYQNVIGAMTINSVTCFSDTVTPAAPIINLQRQVGVAAPANILTGDLTCSTAGASTASFAISTLNLDDKVDFVMVTAGGGAKRVTVVIKTTMN